MKRIVFTLLFMALPFSVSAYDCITIGMAWPGDPVTLSFNANPNGAAAGAPEEQLVAIEAAMAVWNEDGGANISFSLAGETGDIVDGIMNGTNDISFSGGTSPFASDTLAHTYLWSCWDAGIGAWENCESDIVIYPEIDEDVLDWYSGESLPPPGVALDLQTYVTHELGHAAALGHPSPDISEAIMSGVPVGGGDSKRDLGGYDQECLQALYPPADDPEDPPEDDPPDDPPEDDPPEDDPPEDDPPEDDPPEDDPDDGGEDDSGSGGYTLCTRYPYICVVPRPYLHIRYCDIAPPGDPRCWKIDLCARYPHLCEYFRYYER